MADETPEPSPAEEPAPSLSVQGVLTATRDAIASSDAEVARLQRDIALAMLEIETRSQATQSLMDEYLRVCTERDEAARARNTLDVNLRHALNELDEVRRNLAHAMEIPEGNANLPSLVSLVRLLVQTEAKNRARLAEIEADRDRLDGQLTRAVQQVPVMAEESARLRARIAELEALRDRLR